ncbi:MAG: histidine phosphatase family protein [Clostridia bacterium]|nr:histidine phosphatase family protein [Clostridia bacterium]
MKIYVIRHGESINNLKGLWTGWYDAPLTEKGILDAKKAGEFIKGVKFDKVYSSDLSRAIKTTQTALPNCEFETSHLLREIKLGSLENTPIKEMTAQQREIIKQQDGYTSFGGESYGNLKQRILEFRDHLEQLSCENVAIFCHGGWLRNFLYLTLDTPSLGNKIICNNCTVGIFEFKNDTWSLHSWINLP